MAMIEDLTPSGPSILVVEDDETIGELLHFMLERSGYVPVLIRNGRDAVSHIQSQPPPALAIFDVMLPYDDGFKLVSQARAQPRWGDVPLLMLSAKSQEQDIVRALDAGANDYVIKPFAPKELLARVKRLLHRAR
jgi:DNA-binding response OmpR family regulator